jgi:hypothetical protein
VIDIAGVAATKITGVVAPAPPPAAPPAAVPPLRVATWAARDVFAVRRVVFSTSKVAILVVRVLLLVCSVPTVCCTAFNWLTSCMSWAVSTWSVISLLFSKWVHHVETMVAGVGLTWKSKSTSLLGDTSGDWAKYVDFLR